MHSLLALINSNTNSKMPHIFDT